MRAKARVVGDRAITASAASASQMGRFATKWLPARNFKNMRLWTRTRLADLLTRWIDKYMSGDHRGSLCSTWIRARARFMGEQEGRAYNGHLGCTRCHPLFVFNPAMSSGACCAQASPRRRWLTRGAGAGCRSLPGP
jgi:hypothetical protein